MFRKPKQKSTNKKRTLRRNENNDEDDEDRNTIQAAIQKTQKKQRLLSSLPVATGEISSSSNNNEKKMGRDATTAAEGPTDTGELSVLEKKHKQAMEDYIQEQLQKGDTTVTNENNEQAKTSGIRDDKAALYQELAQEIYTSKNAMNDNNIGPSSSQQQDNEDRGTVLVGGTGMAEVRLPPQQQQNNRPRHHHRVFNKNLAVSSSSAIPTAKKSSTVTTAALPSRSMVRNHEPSEATSARMAKDDVKANERSEGAQDAASASIDESRMGFDAFKRQQQHRHNSKDNKSQGHRFKKSRDDMAIAKFLQNNRRY